MAALTESSSQKSSPRARDPSPGPLHIADLDTTQMHSRRLEPLEYVPGDRRETRKRRRKKKKRKEIGEEDGSRVRDVVESPSVADSLLEASTLHQLQAQLDPLYAPSQKGGRLLSNTPFCITILELLDLQLITSVQAVALTHLRSG